MLLLFVLVVGCLFFVVVVVWFFSNETFCCEKRRDVFVSGLGNVKEERVKGGYYYSQKDLFFFCPPIY